jgi:N-methylhydantoinase A
MKLSRNAAAEAVAQIASGLELNVEKVADGIVAVVNENMAAAARVHVAERGYDAPHFALLVTGGGGPLHGCDVARRLGISRVICPPGAGVASALGLLIAPARVDRSTTIARHLSNISPAELEVVFKNLEDDAAHVIEDTLTPGASYVFERAADIRFVGQGFEIVTRLPQGPFDDETPAKIKAEFAIAYDRVFGQVPPVDSIELINLRLTAIEKLVDRPLNLGGTGKDVWKIGGGKRDVWDESKRIWQSLKVLARDALKDGEKFVGPLIIEDASSTLVIPEGARAQCDSSGNLIVDLNSAEAGIERSRHVEGAAV